MALSKRGEVKIATVLVWILIAGAVAYVANFGGFQNTVNGFFGGGAPSASPNQGSAAAPVLTDTKDCPTDGTTTYTVNIQDALTTTATSLYPEYYVFNGNQLIKEGTLTSSANTISLSCGKDYQVLLINTTAKGDLSSSSGAYPKVVDLKARIAQQTLNEKMYTVGQAKIYKIVNPVETAGSSNWFNMSLPANSEKSFEIMFGANYTQRAFNKPLIVCNVNVSEITTITLSSFNDGKKPVVRDVPRRITATTGRTNYAWEYPGMLDMTQGIITATGSLKSASTMPTGTNAQNMTCILVDQTKWKKAAYKTATSIDTAFGEGAENTETLADVGGPDTVADCSIGTKTSCLSFVNDLGT